MLRRASVLGVLALAVLGLSACGPSGKVNGRVVVEGGSAAGVLVRVLGPTSVGVVTDDTGAFKAEALPDGSYQVIADVPNTDVPTQRAAVKVANGTATPADVTLTFKASVGVVEGKVVFANGEDAAGLTVTLAGTESRGVQTATGGAYRFEGLKAGAYSVSTEVPDSRERRQALSVLVGPGSPAGPLPDLTFTLTGTLTGNVKAGTTNARGATVEVPGTDRSAVTDAAGNFILYDVPTGTRTVQARLNAAVATQQVTVVRGANAALAFTLQTALTGRLEGTVGFASGVTNTAITVSVAGTTWSTSAAVNGEWSLTVPPGMWEVVADAPNYPRKSLGVFNVAPGATTVVPGAKMSIYRKIPWDQPVSAAVLQPPLLGCEGDYTVLVVQTATDVTYSALNHQTLSRRAFAAGSVNELELSSKCKFVAWSQGANIFIQELATGVQRLFAGPPTNGIRITTDEAFMFFRVGNTLHRVNLSTWQDDTFSANAHHRIGRERYLVSASTTAPISYNLVTRSGSTAAFPSVGDLGVISDEAGVAWATTNCTTVAPIVCTLQLLAATATSPVSVANPATVPITPGWDPDNSTRDWFHFNNPGGGLFSILVKVDTGQAVAMPQATTWIRFSPNGARVAYLSTLALGQALREEAVPPTGNPTPVTTSSTAFSTGLSQWVSNTRFVSFDGNVATPRRVDIKSGALTNDTDVTGPVGNTARSAAGAVTWARASTSKRVALVGDSADFVLDSPGTTPFGVGLTVAYPPYSMLVTQANPAVPITKAAGISTDANTVHVVDAVKNEVRKVAGYRVDLSALPGFAHTLAIQGASGLATGFLMPTTDQPVIIAEPGTLPFTWPAVFGPGGVGYIARDVNDARAVLLARLNPPAP